MKLIFIELTSLLLVLLTVLLLSLHSSGAQPITPTNSTTIAKSQLSVIQTIENAINNSEICPSSKDILKSKYLKTCNSLPYPTNDTKLVPENTDLFLCLSIYDRIFQICLAKSLSPVGSEDSSNQPTVDPAKSILTNVALLDSSINKIVDSSNENKIMTSESICNTSMEHYPYSHYYNKTEIYVTQLKGPFKCGGSCVKKGKLSPLCIAIRLIDDQVLSIIEATNIKEKIKEKNSGNEKADIKESPSTKMAIEPSLKKQDISSPEINNDNNPKKSDVKINENVDKKDDKTAGKVDSNLTSQNAPPPVKDDGKNTAAAAVDAGGESTKKVTTGSEKPTNENKSTVKDTENTQDLTNNESNFEDIQAENGNKYLIIE